MINQDFEKLPDISKEELNVIYAIRKMEYNKSPGDDQIPIAVIHMGENKSKEICQYI